jgi:hypothetical protein
MHKRPPTIFFWFSAAALVLCAAWCLSTFDEPFLPLWPAFALAVGIFPVHFRTVTGLIRWSDSAGRTRREGFSAWLKEEMPRAWQLIGGALFFVFWLLAATALWTLRHGGPAIVNGHTFARNHGSLTPISLSVYHELQLAEQRLLTAVAGAFYLLGVLYNAVVLRSSQRRYTTTRSP